MSYPSAFYISVSQVLILCGESRLITYTDVLGNLSGVFSGILAFAFDKVSGAHGLSGWQWLFLTEGLVTIVLGIAVKLLLPDCKTLSVVSCAAHKCGDD